jgi:hypothetical protein
MAKTKQSIIRHANEFIEMASADIRAKLVEVMENTDLDADEIADALDIDEEEVEAILEGEGVVTLDAFAKILIATNHCVVVKQLPPEAMEDDEDEDDEDLEDEDDDIEDEDDEPACPEEFEELFHEHRHGAKLPPSPPFSSMKREQLERIIKSKLWDTEIDMDHSSREELVLFLNNKDKRLREMLEKKESAKSKKDKSIEEFRKLLEEKMAENPRLKDALAEMLK